MEKNVFDLLSFKIIIEKPKYEKVSVCMEDETLPESLYKSIQNGKVIILRINKHKMNTIQKIITGIIVGEDLFENLNKIPILQKDKTFILKTGR